MNQVRREHGWNYNSNGLLWDEYRVGTELNFLFISPNKTCRDSHHKKERMQTFMIRSSHVRHGSVSDDTGLKKV